MLRTMVWIGLAGAIASAGCEQSPPGATTQPGGSGATSAPATAPAGEGAGGLKDEIQRRLAAAQEAARQKRDQYRQALERELTRLDEQVTEARRKLAEATEAARPELERQLKDLEERAARGRAALTRLLEASGAAWDELRRGFENAIADVRGETPATQPATNPASESAPAPPATPNPRR